MGDFLSRTYATDDALADMNVVIIQFTQLSYMTTTEYAEVLWNKMLCCNLIYNEKVLKRIYMEGL